jgi:hypothetical protein
MHVRLKHVSGCIIIRRAGGDVVGDSENVLRCSPIAGLDATRLTNSVRTPEQQPRCDLIYPI